MMRAAFDRRRTIMTPMLNEIDGVIVRRARGRVLRLPVGQGLLGRSFGGERPTRRRELAELLHEAKVAVVPGEAFGAPGYFRLSYALGDDDLVEGVSRLAALFAEAQDSTPD